MKIYRQLSYNTDPGVLSSFLIAEDNYFTQFEIVEEPEQERYTARYVHRQGYLCAVMAGSVR